MSAKHSFVMVGVTLLVVWGALTLLLAFAQSASTSYSFNSTNATWNVSDDQVGVDEGVSVVDAFVDFHIGIWQIDLVLGGIFALYGAWVVATTFFGIGGGG